MKVAVANDHRGIEAKEQIKIIVTELGNECIDLGTNAEGPVDYPDLAYLYAAFIKKIFGNILTGNEHRVPRRKILTRHFS